MTGITEFISKCPEQYSYLREIINFEKLEYEKFEDNPIDRYIVYQASGCKNYPKDENVRIAARKMHMYREKGVETGEEAKHADACNLVTTIYGKLWPEHHKLAPLGDTMNSCNTTINLWFKTQLMKDDNENRLKCINKKKCDELSKIDYFYFKNDWAKVRSILLYDADPKWFQELLEEAKEFLSVAYTIGNFIPCPKNCNKPRGTGPVKDYWDLTLWYIYLWYKFKSDELLKKIVQDGYVEYKEWLASFRTWDNFVEQNYLQDFVEWGEKPYGRPKEFWNWHFTGEVLPNNEEQIKAFFTHATECIKARSERMVKALTEKSGEE